MGVAVIVLLDHHRDHVQMPVAHAPLGDDLVGETPDPPHRAAEDGHLQAVVVIQVHVHAGERELVGARGGHAGRR